MKNNWLSYFLLRAAQRCQRMGVKHSNIMVPGQLMVDGKTITSLQPLGNPRTPGLTKARRLSLKGDYNGRAVKIYSAFSDKQVHFRQALNSQSVKGVAFPEIIAAEGNLVVEEWVSGKSVAKLDSNKKREAEEAVINFFQECQTSSWLTNLARVHNGAFCYFNDYLLKRLETWRYIEEVSSLIQHWNRTYASVSDSIEVTVSHPDISEDNLVYSDEDQCWIIIDNELLGIGAGWLLDRKNSFLSSQYNYPVNASEDVKEFVDISWELRKLGSAFDRHDFQGVGSILRNYN